MVRLQEECHPPQTRGDGRFCFVGLLIASLIAITYFYFQAIDDRDAANLARTNEKEQRELEAEQRKLAEFQTYVARIAAAEASIRSHAIHDVMRNLYRTPPKHRAWEYWYIYRQRNLSLSTLGFRDQQQYGHHDQVYSVDYHPGKNMIVSASRDGSVVIWDPDKKEILGRHMFQQGIRCVRFSPDNLIAMGFTDRDAVVATLEPGENGKLRIVDTGIRLSTDGLPVHDLDFSPDGGSILIAAGVHHQRGAAWLYDHQSRKLLRKIDNGDKPVLSVAWGLDGKWFATADNTITLWDLESETPLKRIRGHANWVRAIAIRPDGKQLASCSYEPEVKIWGTKSGKHLKSLHGHTSFVSFVEYSPDGKLIATGSADSTLRTWNARNASPLSVQWGQYSGIHELSFSPDSSNVATCGSWCVKTWESRYNPDRGFGKLEHRKILDLKISPDSRRLLTCDRLGYVREWDLSRGVLRELLQKPVGEETPVRSVDWSPDGRFAAWASDNGTVSIHNLKSGSDRIVSTHQGPATSVCFSSDSHRLYSSSHDRTVLVTDMADGSSKVFCQSDLPIEKVLASPDGRWVVFADEKKICVYESRTVRQVGTWQRERGQHTENFSMAIHPHGNQLVAPISNNSAGVWSLPDGRLLGKLVEHSQPIQSVAYTPDGRRLATSSREGNIKLWDTERLQLVLTLQGFRGYGEAIDFSPDNLRLVGGLYDGSIRTWEALPISERPPGEQD